MLCLYFLANYLDQILIAKNLFFLKMNHLDPKFIVKSFEKVFNRTLPKRKHLFIVLGLLGDFDSFEYVQSITRYLEKLNRYDIDLFIVGIGNKLSKERFCKYTKLPDKYLKVISNSDLHDSLNVDRGLKFSSFPILNLILMCMGFGSPGTISEVLRGYIGDIKGHKIFTNRDNLSELSLINLNPELFNFINKSNSQRPFELATLRLINMLEVLSNWDVYMMNGEHLTQRSATFLIDSNNNLLYSYYSKGLLGFAENMSNPLEFLERLK